MKKNLVIWSIALVLVVIAFNVVNRNNSTSKAPDIKTTEGNVTLNDNKAKDDKIINFTLQDLNEKKVSLSDFKGKNIYLNFFATWCPPCRSEMPDIEKLYQKYKDKDMVFLAVDLGEDNETVKSFMEKNGFHFNVLMDIKESIAAQYNITSIPVSIFIDKNSNIIARNVGAMSGEAMESNIKKLIEAK